MFLYKGHRGLATIYISWMIAETKSSCKICNVRKDSAVSYLRYRWIFVANVCTSENKSNYLTSIITSAKSTEIQEEHEREEYATFKFYKTVIRHRIWKI